MDNKNYDAVIIGGGMVGLSVAHQLILKDKNISILIIDKEKELGLHSSGRNSGILHAGIYYQPNSLKAKICINGAKRLKEWCIDYGINVLESGKVISPQDINLDSQIDVLYERGKKNGAEVYIINESEFKSLLPFGRTSSGRALWSPQTSVVNPKDVINKLKKVLEDFSVVFSLGTNIEGIDEIKKEILTNKSTYSYGYLFNCAGLQSDLIAKKFGIAKNKVLLPFKGIYWKLSPQAPFRFTTNLYPVPDLTQPFLGIHITPSVNGDVYLGPTAIPALGRENYKKFQNIEPLRSFQFFTILMNQYVLNKNGFRKYSKEQLFDGIKINFVRNAQKLIPQLNENLLLPTPKVGIRPQLFNKDTSELIQDFLTEKTSYSLHVLNAISPAFTASFEFADWIINQSDM